MKSGQGSVAVLIFLMLGADAAIGQSNRTAEDAIRAADAAWLQTYIAKDAEKAAAFCDEHGSLLEPNTPIATGSGAIRKLIASDFAIKDYKLVWRTEKAGVARSGDLGYTSGGYDWSFTDAAGRSIKDKGKYLTVWKKQADGSWKVLFDMFNTDLPPA